MHKDYNFLVIKPSIVLKVTAKLFQSGGTQFLHSHQQCTRDPVSSAVLLAFGITTSYLGGPNRYTSLWY